MENDTFASRLKDVGYITGFFGKYNNDYDEPRIPPGWDRWFAFREPRNRADWYEFNSDGKLRRFYRATDNETDVIASRVVDFVRSRRANQPWPAYVCLRTTRTAPITRPRGTRTNSRARPGTPPPKARPTSRRSSLTGEERADIHPGRGGPERAGVPRQAQGAAGSRRPREEGALGPHRYRATAEHLRLLLHRQRLPVRRAQAPEEEPALRRGLPDAVHRARAKRPETGLREQRPGLPTRRLPLPSAPEAAPRRRVWTAGGCCPSWPGKSPSGGAGA